MSTPSAPPPQGYYPPQPPQGYPQQPPQGYYPPPPQGYYPQQPPQGYYPPQPQPGYYPYPPQGYYPPQPPPADGGEQTKVLPQLTAEDVSGAVVGAKATFRATLLDPDGQPIQGAMVTFKMTGGKVIGSAATGSDGVATLNSGSHMTDPLGVWGPALAGGYEAHFAGNKKFQPATASASITPALFAR
ncbi:Ig-like domain-containing protein [Streptomyces sp. NPDC059080]|uniref:Ig-like domain-containing protein n=1 Tax=Streptomyces sp. NPDC059080 TaxID=3346718 RepID=UPI00368D4CEC